MPHRKWREIDLQPCSWLQLALSGWCLFSLFFWGSVSLTDPVHECNICNNESIPRADLMTRSMYHERQNRLGAFFTRGGGGGQNRGKRRGRRCEASGGELTLKLPFSFGGHEGEGGREALVLPCGRGSEEASEGFICFKRKLFACSSLACPPRSTA